MRILRSLINLCVLLTLVAAVLAVLGLYLALSGRSLALLRAVVSAAGRAAEGQRTERMDLDVRVRPDVTELSGSAELDVRATEEPRPRLYFLLNDGLAVERIWQVESGKQVPLGFFRIGPLVIVQLSQPLAADQTARIGIAYRGNPLRAGLGQGGGIFTPDDVLIKVDQFWFPNDLQSFFVANVHVTLPAHLALLHNGQEASRERIGTSTRVRWTTPRPIAGFALVAGAYRESVKQSDAVRYRVALPETLDLDSAQLLASAEASDATLTARYGPSGFPSVTIVIHPNLDRAFNDGAGLIAIAPRYLRRGDYGFATVAHEIAHNWWGATVAEKWLQPGTGGEWIVEGFAEFSSFVAVQQHFGDAALLRRLEGSAYDPTQSRSVASMSVLDNTFDPTARATIYNKGAWVTWMLQGKLGDEGFFAAARQLIDRFRYRQATDADVEATFADVSKQDLTPFFATWVRSDATFDLALDPQDGGAAARNHGTAWAPAELALWRFSSGSQPEHQTIALDATTTLANASRLVLDPLAATADMYRSNNVFPQRQNPRAVARSSRGDLMVVYGEPHSWSPATVTCLNANGQPLHTWEFDRGIVPEPAWAADGMRILAVEVDRNGVASLLALNASDGSRTTLGHSKVATATANATIAVRDDRLISKRGGKETTLVRHPGRQLGAPLISPDETRIAYTSSSNHETDLRVVAADGGDDRLLFTWGRTDVTWQWDAGSGALFAILPGDWDWQLWEIPLGSSEPRALVREAGVIEGLASSTDGAAIAFTATATVDYGRERREVFVLNRRSGKAQRYNLNGATVHGVAWLNAGELLAIVSDPDIIALPRFKELRRLVLQDGSLANFP